MAQLPKVEQLEKRTITPQTGVIGHDVVSGQEGAMGAATAKFGEMVLKESIRQADELSTTQAEDAWNKYQSAADQRRIGDGGFSLLKTDAMVNGNTFEKYTGLLAEDKKKISEGMNPDTLDKFEKRAAITDRGFQLGLMEHHAAESKAYAIQVNAGIVTTANNSIIASPTDNNVVIGAISRVQMSGAALYKSQGMDPAVVAQKNNDISDQLLVARYDAIATANPILAHQMMMAAEKPTDNPDMKMLQIKNPDLKGKVLDKLSNEAMGMEVDNKTSQDLATAKQKMVDSEQGATMPDGTPKRVDVRALLLQVPEMAKAAALAANGPDPNNTNPQRAKYEKEYAQQLTAKISRDAVAIAAEQQQVVEGSLGIIGGGPEHSGRKPTTQKEFVSTPEGRAFWDRADNTTKHQLQTQLNNNLIAETSGSSPHNAAAKLNLAKDIVSGKVTNSTQITPHLGELGVEGFVYMQQFLADFNQAGEAGKAGIAGVNKLTETFRKAVNNSVVGKTNQMSYRQDLNDAAADTFNAALLDKVKEIQKKGGNIADVLNPNGKDYPFKPGANYDYLLQHPAEALDTQAKALREAPYPMMPEFKTDAEKTAWVRALPPGTPGFKLSDGSFRALRPTQPKEQK